MIELIISAFLLGILGTGHCIAMCGGISAALGLSSKSQWLGNTIYQFGRITTYCIAGLLFGALGAWIPAEFTLVLRSIAAILLIIVALYIAGWSRLIINMEAIGKPVWKFISPLAKKFTQPRSFTDYWITGMIWGWLPCGLVYSALGLAILQTDIMYSTLTMLAFGLGTVPGMVTISILGMQFKKFFNNPVVRFTGALILFSMSAWMMFTIWQSNING